MVERRRGKKTKVTVLLIAICVAFLSFFELPDVFGGGLVFHAFDVGQGDSFLFRFPNASTMLVDAGPKKNGKELVRKLRKLGVRRIDVLVATHPHEDHIGGMTEVIEAFPVGKIWDSGYNHGSATQRAMLKLVEEKKIRFGRPRAGFIQKFDDVSVEVLAPVKTISGTKSDANNNSIVLLVSFKKISFLMTGDMEKPERRSIGRFPHATVLKLAHHGSADATDRRMLEQIRPEIGIISCARENPYGHPHKKTLRLLADFGVKVYETHDGEIVIRTDGEKYVLKRRGGK